MKTGGHLKIVKMGSNVQGVRLEGNPAKPEYDEFRVCFPGGDISVTRCTDGGAYWAHVRVDNKIWPIAGEEETHYAHITDARLDIFGKNASDANLGDFEDPNLFHAAFRIELDK